jgi:hypothetical protein
MFLKVWAREPLKGNIPVVFLSAMSPAGLKKMERENAAVILSIPALFIW